MNYLAGRRIIGNSDEAPLIIDFEDTFSSDNWTDSDSNDIGVANGKLNWYNNGTNQYENSYYDLGSVSDTKWILRHTLKISGSPSSDEIPYQFIISNTANANWNTSSSCLGLWVYVDRNNAWRRIYTANKVNSTSGGDNGAQASPRYWSDFAYDTTYYITTTRTSATNMTVEIRTGSHSGSIVSNGTLTLTIPSGLTGLRYLTANQGAQGTGLSMEVDNVEFVNNATSIPTATSDTLDTSTTQDGTVFTNSTTGEDYVNNDGSWNKL